MKPDFGDRFSHADTYEAFVGRWSRPVAQRFVAWLEIAPGCTWLDIGSGTGILTEVILQEVSPARVVGIDSSPEYIDFARQRIGDKHAEFRVEDVAQLAVDSPQFDVAVAGLVLNFLPDPQQAVTRMVQAIRSGGQVAAYVWDFGDRMEMMRHFWDAAIEIDPAARAMDAGQRFTLCRPDNLQALFHTVGLHAVDVIPIDILTRFKDFDDYWLPFLGAQGLVSKYLRGLNDERRSALRDQLQRQLPTADTGEISLMARAWAVKGHKGPHL
jgi:trans-aconitate methyltransferase